jgi:hypothetical protein
MSSWIRIGSDRRDIPPVDEQWITQQINGRKRDGQAVCVQVHIDSGDANITFASAGCGGSGGGGGRPPNSAEQGLSAEWRSRGLNEMDFPAGQLVAFLKQAVR